MKLGRDFQDNRDHGYGLPEGTVVRSARFGRTQADVWQDAEPSRIWRGEPARVVGRFPVRLWRFVVKGELSGVALTEAGARAAAERFAWGSEANRATARRLPPYRHQLTADEEKAEREGFRAIIEGIYRDFPADPGLYPPAAGDAEDGSPSAPRI